MYSFLLKDIKNNKIKKEIKILYYLNNLREKKSKIKKDGGIHTYNYTCEIYNFKFRIVKSTDDIFITILNQKYNYDCAFIVINIDQLCKNNNETYALLNGIKGNIDCAVPQLPVFGKGSILLKCIINFFKNKWQNIWKNNCPIIKYIQLSDNSKKYCDNNDNNSVAIIYMSDFYTLIRGVPWYYKFGFIHNTSKANMDIEENNKKMEIIKGSDIDIKKIIINSLNNLDKKDMKDMLRYEMLELHKKNLYKFFKDRQNELIKNIIEEICKKKVGCKLIYCIHEEIMKEMNIISIKSKYKDDTYNLYLNN